MKSYFATEGKVMALQINGAEDSQGNSIPHQGQTQDVTLTFSVETDFPNQQYRLQAAKIVLAQGKSDSNRMDTITVDVSQLTKAKHSFHAALSDSNVSRGYVIELQL